MSAVILSALPEEHPLRNKTLAEIGAEVRNLRHKEFRPVAGMVIARYAYNSLGYVWRDCNEFRAEEKP